MKAWIGGWSIATKLFVLQLVMIVALAAIAVVWIWADARADVERDAAAKSMAVAETLASDPFVHTALGTGDPSPRLQPYAEDVMAEAGVDFVTIMAPDRTRYTHRDPAQIGQQFLGNIDRALAGYRRLLVVLRLPRAVRGGLAHSAGEISQSRRREPRPDRSDPPRSACCSRS